MKKTLLLVFIFILSINAAYGQNAFDKNNFFTLNLISPTFSYTPRWNLGHHTFINKQFVLGAEIGFGSYATTINFAPDSNWIYNEYKSFEFSPELKYLFNINQKTKRFISFDVFYIYHTDNLKNKTYANQTDMNFYNYESADYQRNKFGFNLNYGLITTLSKKIGIIYKIGLGLKMRSVKFSNIVNPTIDNYYEESDTFFTTINDFQVIEGFHTNINFNFELQLYFKYKKKSLTD